MAHKDYSKIAKDIFDRMDTEEKEAWDDLRHRVMDR